MPLSPKLQLTANGLIGKPQVVMYSGPFAWGLQLETADDEKIGARFLSEEMLDEDGAMSTKLKSSANGNEDSTDLTQTQLERMLAKVEYVGSGTCPM